MTNSGDTPDTPAPEYDPNVALRLLGVGVTAGQRHPISTSRPERRSSLEGQPGLNPNATANPEAETDIQDSVPSDGEDLWDSYGLGPGGDDPPATGSAEDDKNEETPDLCEFQGQESAPSEEPAPPKRGRGRPKGSTNKKKKADSGNTRF